MSRRVKAWKRSGRKGIEADRDPVQASIVEGLGLLGKEDAVCGQGKVCNARIRR